MEENEGQRSIKKNYQKEEEKNKYNRTERIIITVYLNGTTRFYDVIESMDLLNEKVKNQELIVVRFPKSTYAYINPKMCQLIEFELLGQEVK